jgi:antitoxin (DNA-binding transcriptional repressor) of toxin-antitoxin stability system
LKAATPMCTNPPYTSDFEALTWSDLAKNLQAVLRRVETGAEIIIERDAHPVAVIRPAETIHRKISECIGLMPADSTATIDPDFAKDVDASVFWASWRWGCRFST